MKRMKIGKSGKFCLIFDKHRSYDSGMSVHLRLTTDKIKMSDNKYAMLLHDAPETFCENADEFIDAIFEAKLFIKKIENSDVFIKTELFNG